MISLQSGSNGNCVYVESGDVRLFFDAGISGIQAQERLALHGKVPHGVDALFISHEHADHIKCAGVFSRKFRVPIYVTEKTYRISKRRMSLGDIKEIQHFKAGNSVRIKHVTVETIATPHDSVDGSVFVIDDGIHRLGICTDLGHVYGDLHSLVSNVDALFLESNYDEHMLFNGDYPPSLKRRISGPGGHISNKDAAELIEKSATSRLKWLCLAHLSEENNTPALAMQTHRSVLGHVLPIHLGSRYKVSEMFRVGDESAILDAVPLQPSFQPTGDIETKITALPIERFFDFSNG